MDLPLPPHIYPGMREYRDPRETLKSVGIKIGGYIRISTNKDAQLTSIDNQKKVISEWALAHGYVLVRFYTDIKTGAFMHLRDEMNQMRQDLRNGLIQGLVAKEISRTSRDVLDVLELKREIASYGGFFATIKESYDSRTDDDEFFLVLHAALAQKERKTTASRVKVTQILKAREGKTNVSSPAFGYMLSEDRQHLVPNPKTAPIYQEMVDKFLQGWGQLKIARWLNSLGIKTKKGKWWSSNSVRTVLMNPVYLGATIYNTTMLMRDPAGKPKRVLRPREEWIIRHGTHEPLVTEEKYRRVLEIADVRREKYRHEWNSGLKYLGSAILRCAVCGGKIYGQRMPKKRSKGEYYYWYTCQNRSGRCTPPLKMWDMRRVDYMLMELLRDMFADKDRLRNKIAENIGMAKDQTVFSEYKEQRERLQSQMASIDKSIKRQQLAFENEAITIEEYKNRMAELRRDRQAVSDELSRVNRRLALADNLSDRVETVFERVCRKLDSIHDMPLDQKMELLRAVFEAVYIDSDYNIVDIRFRL